MILGGKFKYLAPKLFCALGLVIEDTQSSSEPYTTRETGQCCTGGGKTLVIKGSASRMKLDQQSRRATT